MRPTALALALVAAAACSRSSRSPWARRLSPDQRRAWVGDCGIPADRIDAGRGGSDREYDTFSGQLDRGDPATGPSRVACSLHWDRKADHIFQLSVRASFIPRPRATADDIAPYLALVLRELRPDQQAVARVVADGPESQVRTGGLVMRGGYSPDPASWSFSIYVAQ